MSFTAGSFAIWSPALRPAGQHSNDQAGGNAAERRPANHGQHLKADTAANSAAQDEARRSGNRESGERLVLDVLAQIPASVALRRRGIH
jgi:hypothetical protein